MSMGSPHILNERCISMRDKTANGHVALSLGGLTFGRRFKGGGA